MIRTLSRWGAIFIALVVALVGGMEIYVSLRSTGPEPVAPVAGVPTDLPTGMSAGEYLTKAADCAACHTREGGAAFAGGRPFKLPFGTIYSTDITSGNIASWTDDEFVAAVREGKGRHHNFYPAMSYTSYTQMSRDDVLAIKRYLTTVPAAHQPVPRNDVIFPFNQRWGMHFWNLFFLKDRRFQPEAGQSQQWNRGAYLGTALGHCAECHAPRNLAYAVSSQQNLTGEITGGWKAYNITSDKQDGIGAWSDAQLANFLHSGHAAGRSSAAGPMAEAVENSLQYLTQSDLRALVTYLRSIPARSGGQSGGTVDLRAKGATGSNAVLPGQTALADNPRGLRMLSSDCAGCHQWNGDGRQKANASLLGSRAANDPSGLAVMQVVLHGANITVDGKTEMMPGFGAVYSDQDVADVSNYVLKQFGDKDGKVTAKDVHKAR